MTAERFNQQLLDFLASSPSPFHAAAQVAAKLEQQGFISLPESASWSLKPGGRYYVLRKASSLIAFQLGEQSFSKIGMAMVGAHLDSPCLKIKPLPDVSHQGVHQLGVEVYGGALLHPWFDRDLSIAGQVQWLNSAGELQSTLLDFDKPIAFIPSLAIHLDRKANHGRAINAQKHLPAVLHLAQSDTEKHQSFHELLAVALKQMGHQATEIIAFDLMLYDHQPPTLVGLNNEFIASARLDNLLSCHAATQALCQTPSGSPALIACFNHEEVGSVSISGAQGSFFQDVLLRIEPNAEARIRGLQKSLFISADNAHAVHPNFSEYHEPQHLPKINGGPVIKVNANQHYATNSQTSARFRMLCMQEGIAVQDFVIRTDLRCSSTIGPITAAQMGIPTVDVGIAQWAMHSCREICGSQDPHMLFKVLKRHLSNHAKAP